MEKHHMTQSSEQNNPFIMQESSPQLAWLFNLDAVVTRGMGGPLTERDGDLTGIQDILDLACGSGGWVLEVAFSHPRVTVTGVDLNESLMKYVRAHAQAQRIQNAHFRVMDILKPLDFPDASFDLVNARTLFSSLKPDDWPALLQECKRILRPDGVLRLTELERSNTSSPAVEHLWDIFARALNITGRSFSPDGRHIGIVPQLSRLFHQAGFEHVHNRAYAPDISPWAADFASWREHDTFAWTLLEPFFIESGMTTKEELDQIRAQAVKEMMAEDFCGTAFFLTTWGEKPSA
jgi:ubiquinone/menaquinone biosynthesis C-methylase UbiE